MVFSHSQICRLKLLKRRGEKTNHSMCTLLVEAGSFLFFVLFLFCFLFFVFVFVFIFVLFCSFTVLPKLFSGRLDNHTLLPSSQHFLPHWIVSNFFFFISPKPLVIFLSFFSSSSLFFFFLFFLFFFFFFLFFSFSFSFPFFFLSYLLFSLSLSLSLSLFFYFSFFIFSLPHFPSKPILTPPPFSPLLSLRPPSL